MAKKGLTKKQFQIQMASMAIFVLLAVYWIVRGVCHESAVEWILGALYFVLIVSNTIYLIIQRKRYPVDDPQLDEQAVDNFKTGLKGMGIVLAFIAFGFLIAIGLAAILAFPILHLIKGDFTWGDFFINAGLNIGIALVLGVFFFFGSQVPKKTEK